MKGRTFTADEIARVFGTQQGDEFDFAGIHVTRMVAKGVFQITRDGKEFLLKDAAPAELEAISAVLWAEFGPFMSSIDDELTPENLKDKPDDDPLTPDELRNKTDDDPLGYPGDPGSDV